MNPTWRSEAPPPAVAPPGALGWWRILRRGVPLALLMLCALAIALVLRLAERPWHGPGRPWSGRVAPVTCRLALALIGIGRRADGRPIAAAGLIAANHSSWLDIFALNACGPLRFVAKAEVAGWPGIGPIARAAGTVFVRRDRREAAVQVASLRQALAGGLPLLLFPEGTSTDGQRVLPFKPTLLAAAEGPGTVPLQPVSLRWQAPAGTDPRHYGWWDDMGFGPHLLAVLALKRQGSVRVIWHEPLPPGNDRRALAAAAEAAVRQGFAAAQPETSSR